VESDARDDVAPDRDEWMRRTGPLYPAMVALRQLTRLPVLRGVTPTLEDLTRAAPWYAAIGGLVGGLVALAAMLVQATDMVPAIAGATAVALSVILGGGLHEGGFARAVELIAGGADREQPYAREALGLYGVVAVISLLAARALLLLGIAPGSWIGALILGHIALGWVPVFLSRVGDKVGEPLPGERTLLCGQPSWASVGIGAGFAVVVGVLFGGGVGILALVAAAAVAFGLGLFFQRRYNGLSASSLAASGVVCELVVLLIFAAAHPATASPWAS